MKKIILSFVALLGVSFLSGCSLQTATTEPTRAQLMAKATFLKTADGGLDWEPKIKADEKKDISFLNVLSLAADPFDGSVVYLGTESDGIFVSRDGAESWNQIRFPEKVYGIVLDHQNRGTIYASGVIGGRAKIFKRVEGEDEWKELYTEPGEGTVISSMAMDKKNSNVIYVGTSAGAIFKTTDAGKSWHNLHRASAPVTSISFDSNDTSTVYFVAFRMGILKTSNGGEKIEEITENISMFGNSRSIFTAFADPVISGTVYLGTESGILKTSDGGKNWVGVNILESSKTFPIRVISINPYDSREILYVSGKAIYKSVDGGQKWSTFQLDSGKDVSSIVYNKDNPSIIYAGLRKF